MKDKRKVLFFCMIIVANAAFCQYSPKIMRVIPLYSTDSTKLLPFSNTNVLLPVLPADFSATQLGFFCKKEWKFESATKLPLKFRLGSLGYCDWLEGKKGAGLLPVR